MLHGVWVVRMVNQLASDGSLLSPSPFNQGTTMHPRLPRQHSRRRHGVAKGYSNPVSNPLVWQPYGLPPSPAHPLMMGHSENWANRLTKVPLRFRTCGQAGMQP